MWLRQTKIVGHILLLFHTLHEPTGSDKQQSLFAITTPYTTISLQPLN
jgi:hypothetical protein